MRNKKLIILIYLLFSLVPARATWYYIPDTNLQNKLILLGYGSCIVNDSIDSSCPAVQSTHFLNISNSNLHNMDGILAFSNLDTLICNQNYNLYNWPSAVFPNSLKYLDGMGTNLGHNLSSWPPQLVYIDCTFFNDTIMPGLPSSLKVLKCEACWLHSLPSLPSGLDYLSIDNSGAIHQLPVLPSNLHYLDIGGTGIRTVSGLPQKLKVLVCMSDSLTSLPQLPDSLRTLNCRDNLLTTLPTIPPNFITLYAGYNELTTLPYFPPSTNYIDARSNKLISITNFPDSIAMCYLSDNLLTSLPPFPNVNPYMNNIFYFNNNNLTSLPVLSNTLIGTLDASYNQITALSSFPSTLEYLMLDSNFISCLPTLPNSLNMLKGFAAGYTCLPNLPSTLQSITGPSTVCTVPCILPPFISGRIFNDNNFNQVADNNETGHPNMIIRLNPGNYFTISDNQGAFRLPVDDSIAYTIAPSLVPYYTILPSSITTPSLQPGQNDTSNYFAMQPVGVVHDLKVELNGLPYIHSGVQERIFLQVTNNGTVTDTATLRFIPDTQLTFIYCYPPPDTIIGDTLYWYSIPLNPGQNVVYNSLFTPAASLQPGTVLISTAETYQAVPDTTPIDNFDTLFQEINDTTISNIKIVDPSGPLTETQAASGTWLEYTIWFQYCDTLNSYSANVEIFDTIDNNLDLSTFQVVASSFPFILNIHQQVVQFSFVGIDLLDSTNWGPSSRGFIKFKIMPNTNLVAGQFILNRSTNDFNSINQATTNMVRTDITFPSKVENTNNENYFIMYPNPSFDELNLAINFSGCKELLLLLYDITGKQIVCKKIDRSPLIKINLQNFKLKEGVYIAAVTDGVQEFRSPLIILRH